MQSVLEIARINLKANARNSILAAAILCILVPVFAGTANLDANASALPLEMFVSLIGIVLLTPVFAPEQDAAVRDLVSAKYVDVTTVYIIRAVYSIVFAAGMIAAFGMYMKMQNCEVSLLLVLGTAADAVFLGALGMLASALCSNTVIGYMVPMLYYGVNIGMGNKLGKFYLFSMTFGEYNTKLWMFMAGVFLIEISILYQRRRLP